MTEGTFIKLYRKILDCKFYKEKRRFSKSEAWIDILLRAAWETGTLEIESYEKLAQRWNWSKSSVGRFIKILVNENMVEQRRDKLGTTLTVVNWRFYQGTRGKTGTKLTSKSEFLPITEKEEKNIYSEIFSYWNEQGIIKHQELTLEMVKAIDKISKTLSLGQIKVCIERYKKILEDDTFFFSYRWTLVDFLNRKNGIKDFLDDGQKWISYQNRFTKQAPKPKPQVEIKPELIYDSTIKHSWEV